jgi:hypothetical protein
MHKSRIDAGQETFLLSFVYYLKSMSRYFNAFPNPITRDTFCMLLVATIFNDARPALSPPTFFLMKALIAITLNKAEFILRSFLFWATS